MFIVFLKNKNCRIIRTHTNNQIKDPKIKRDALQRLPATLSSILADADDNDTENEHGKDPAKADDNADIDFGPIDSPSAAKDAPERLDCIRLR